MRHRTILTMLMAGAVLAGCKNIYYGTMEKLGYQKREILVFRVQDEPASGEKEVTVLVKEMEASITEANTFIDAMSRAQEVR